MDENKQKIMTLFETGDTLYYSDIAEMLGIDLEKIVSLCQELITEGKICAQDIS